MYSQEVHLRCHARSRWVTLGHSRLPRHSVTVCVFKLHLTARMRFLSTCRDNVITPVTLGHAGSRGQTFPVQNCHTCLWRSKFLRSHEHSRFPNKWLTYQMSITAVQCVHLREFSTMASSSLECSGQLLSLRVRIHETPLGQHGSNQMGRPGMGLEKTTS